MLLFGIFINSILLSVVFGNWTGPAIRESPIGRGIGGTRVDIKQYPFQVSVELQGVYLCGGSIINELFILTSAHMLKDPEDMSGFKVRYGSSTSKRGGRLEVVEYSYFHDNYNEGQLIYDFVLLRLKRPLVFGQNCQPVRLVENDAGLKPGHNLKVLGFSDLAGDQLQIMGITTLSQEQCNRALEDFDEESMMCGFVQYPKNGPCPGDEGNALLINANTQIGILSWVKGCGDTRYAIQFGRIAQAYEWIMRVVKDLDLNK